MRQKSKNISNEEFYDLIAPEYNDQLSTDPTNQVVRTKVSRYFIDQVPKGRVLDFGGGTGLDLPWLLDRDYSIVFCEPSRQMRLYAIGQVKHHPSKDRVLFLTNSDANIANWKTDFPFSKPVDACIANFAVLNCVDNLRQVFEKLAHVIKPGGHIIANVLDARFKLLISRYLKSYLKYFLRHEMITYSRHQDVEQKVYLYSLGKIKNLANPYFKVTNVFPLGGYGFVLVHLSRNDVT
jgi:SAM-dependent methyltransferase